MDEILRESYIEMVQKLKTDAALKEKFLAFINSYDGSFGDEFKNFMSQMISFLTISEVNRIKADAFDKIEKIQDDLKTNLEIVDEDMDIISNEKPIPEEDLED